MNEKYVTKKRCQTGAECCSAAAECLTSLLQIVVSCGCDGITLDEGLCDVRKSPLFNDFVKKISVLANINPMLLTSDREKKSFWLNVLNMLILHALILQIEAPENGSAKLKPKERVLEIYIISIMSSLSYFVLIFYINTLFSFISIHLFCSS